MKTAVIDQAASGEVIAAVSGKRILVTSITIFVAAEVTVKFMSGGAGGTALSGAMTLVKGTPMDKDFCPDLKSEFRGILRTNAGENLYITLGAAIQISGFMTYEEIAP